MSPEIRDGIFWVAVVCCAIAQLFILRAVMTTARDAGRRNDTAAAASTIPVPHRALEIAWAVLPSLLLAGAFYGAWRLMHPASP